MRRHFADDPNVEVIRENRAEGDRRRIARRGATSGRVNGNGAHDRRLVRSVEGRRVDDRRAPTCAVEPPPLPRRARGWGGRLRFVGRLSPPPLRDLDVTVDRLVLRTQAGETIAFTELYELLFPKLTIYCAQGLDDRCEGEDVAQEVLAKAYLRIPSFEVRPEEPFTAWAFRVARNAVLDAKRRAAHRPVLAGQIEVENGEAGSGGPAGGRGEEVHVNVPTPEPEPESIVLWLSDPALATAVDELPERQRQVVVLRWCLAVPNERIAALLGCSEQAVHNLHNRAIRKLRRELLAAGYTSGRAVRAPTLTRVRRLPVLQERRYALRDSQRPAGHVLAEMARKRW